MSQMAPEAPAAPVAGKSEGGGRRGGNVLTRKIGPLPTWVWIAIVAALLLGWALYRARTSSQSSDTSGSDETDASQVPQFVNQTYVSAFPPTAPPPPPMPTPAPLPLPPKQGGPPTRKPSVKTLTVHDNETLRQFAKEHHWTKTTLRAVEKLNHLRPGSKLHKGQKIKRPWAPRQPGHGDTEH